MTQTSRLTHRTRTPGQSLVDNLRLALQTVESKQPVPAEQFENARHALSALPLATGEYARMMANISNADVYCVQREFGAAKFELRLLLNSLV